MSPAMFESQERGLPLFRRGKVRDVYKPSDDRLLIVACDRISAFDHILPTPIPGKGRVLTQISNFFFEQTEHIIANHIVDPDPGPEWYPEIDWFYDDLRGRTVLVRNAQPLVIENIVRGYLAGSGWKEYQTSGTVCGLPLPAGLREADRLPEPIFTPSTKAESGHDENIPFETAVSLVGREVAREGARHQHRSLRVRGALRAGAGHHHRRHQVRVRAARSGELILIDEMFTPDSSRFWPADSYRPGGSPPSFDKQYVRDYLESIEWDKEPPAPALPDDVVANTRAKYEEAMRRLVS